MLCCLSHPRNIKAPTWYLTVLSIFQVQLEERRPPGQIWVTIEMTSQAGSNQYRLDSDDIEETYTIHISVCWNTILPVQGAIPAICILAVTIILIPMLAPRWLEEIVSLEKFTPEADLDSDRRPRAVRPCAPKRIQSIIWYVVNPSNLKFLAFGLPEHLWRYLAPYAVILYFGKYEGGVISLQANVDHIFFKAGNAGCFWPKALLIWAFNCQATFYPARTLYSNYGLIYMPYTTAIVISSAAHGRAKQSTSGDKLRIGPSEPL